MFNSTSSIFLRGINPCTWTWADQFIAWWKLLPLATQTPHQSSKTIADCNLQDLSRLVVKALGQQVLQEDNRLYIIYILRSEHATILSIKLDRIEKYREGFPKCFPKNCAFGRHSIGAVLRCAQVWTSFWRTWPVQTRHFESSHFHTETHLTHQIWCRSPRQRHATTKIY